VESRFGLFGESVSVGAIYVHGLAQKSFCMHPMILLGDEAPVEVCLSPFGDSANLDAR
jgi:hypothetical protein